MKKLVDRLNGIKTISVFGNCKNAGKTTVINHLIELFKNECISLTSIGLDGEKIDQVNFMPKPRIRVYIGHIVATAQNTLEKWSAEYEILEKTNIMTAIGYVFLVKVTKTGNALIAGPSTVSDMKKLILITEKYKTDRILIDGAFFRQSFNAISDGSIYVIGANQSKDMNRVIEHAKATYGLYKLGKPDVECSFLDSIDNISLFKTKHDIREFTFNMLPGNTAKIISDESPNLRFLYLPRTLTKNTLEELILHRKEINYDLILRSPVSIQLESSDLKKLFKLKNHIYVSNPINITAVCYNPYSPQGYSFDNKEFGSALSEALGCEVYNVNEDIAYE